ncbi:hypothetical protein BLX24_03840 [Arsenicibacter rosenii]|uniref:Uncharacterized protein n=1 Tax=Arsenicibacter rosenii TaxID=1750698 RepID=A0A1S2VR07_9BACT|nr:hypothetical protein BLX24_03840 [Arsenicibacter rosenii]
MFRDADQGWHPFFITDLLNQGIDTGEFCNVFNVVVHFLITEYRQNPIVAGIAVQDYLSIRQQRNFNAFGTFKTDAY